MPGSTIAQVVSSPFSKSCLDTSAKDRNFPIFRFTTLNFSLFQHSNATKVSTCISQPSFMCMRLPSHMQTILPSDHFAHASCTTTHLHVQPHSLVCPYQIRCGNRHCTCRPYCNCWLTRCLKKMRNGEFQSYVIIC